MSSLPMGSTPCESCRGRGKTDDESPCPDCGGTGLVPVRPKIERRRLPRYRVDFPVKVQVRAECELEGACYVISEGGISVTLPGPVPAGSVILLQFIVPTHSAEFRLWAVVRHLIGLRHGLEFVSLTEGERLSLRQFCSGLATQTPGEVRAGSK